MNQGNLQQRALTKKKFKENFDRFIPNRSAMDWGYACSMMTGARKGNGKENHEAKIWASKVAYERQLREALNLNRTRIFEYRNKPIVAPVEFMPKWTVKPQRFIPQKPELYLDVPDLIDGYCLQLLDWGSTNVLAIALGNAVYLWDTSKSKGSDSQVVTFDYDKGPVTSLSWAPDGCQIAIGLNNSEVQLWDSTSCQQLRTVRGGHGYPVGSLAWNNHILTTGSMDGKITNYDLRREDPIVGTYRGHKQEVCGLEWSASGQILASGGNDKLLHIWDRRSMSCSNDATPWLHRLADHMGPVRALAWCPFQGNLLASGGVEGDRCIKFWNTQNGSCLKSVDTGSEVCSLLWSKNERELLSSHGSDKNQLTLWKYPSMLKMTELTGHTSRVLYMAQSPRDGSTVASANAEAPHERLLFWKVFGNPEAAKSASKENCRPFAHLKSIR